MTEQTDQELDLSGQKTEEKPSRGRGRPSKDTVRTDVGKAIREGLVELADWLKELDPELAEVLERDAPRMANVLSGRAAKHQRVAKGCERVFGADGPIGALRAFGPFARKLVERLFEHLPVMPGEEFPAHPEEHLAAEPPPIGDVDYQQ